MKHATHPDNHHDPIQRRHGFTCRYCRQPMEPDSKKAQQACPARMQHDDAGRPKPPTPAQAAAATPTRKNRKRKNAAAVK